MRNTIVAFVLVGLAAHPASSDVIFSDNFDAQPDWQSKQPDFGRSGFGWGYTYAPKCTTFCPPENWTAYRVGPSYFSPNTRDTYLINAGGARGGSGKGLTYNVESVGVWGDWAGGGIDKYLGPIGYQELFVRFWIKESPEFCWGSKELNLNAMGKFLRVTALRRDPTIDPHLFNPERYPSPDTCPTMIADAYRRFQPNYGIPAQLSVSKRMAPGYVDGGSTTFPAVIPNDSTTGGEGYCGDNQWHSYEFYVKMNSALDVADGAYRAWIDGRLAGEQTNIPWVKSGTDANGTPMTVATGWNWVMVADNIDSTAFPKSAAVEMARYLDDVVISTHYSGPPASPVNVVATMTDSTMTVKWARGTNGANFLVDGHHIRYGTDPAKLDRVLTVGNITQAQISNLAPGKYYVAVSAFNKAVSGNNENEGLRSVVVSTSTGTLPPDLGDTIAPTVSFSSPASGSTISGVAAINVAASDNIGIAKVELHVDGALLATDAVAPFAFSWNTVNSADGTHSLTAKAFDTAGNVGQVSLSLAVKNVVVPVGDIIAPTVRITSPAYGSTVNGIAAVVATATDNVGVTKVEFSVNGVYQATSTVAPFTFNWNTLVFANAAYSVWAKAFDAAGNSSIYKATLYVANAPADTTAPAVRITSPAYGSTVKGTAAVVATASDNVGVTKVEFSVNGVYQATATVAPFTFNWNTLVFANAAYSVWAKAFDAAGNSSIYKATLYVANGDTTAPTVRISAPVSTTFYGSKLLVKASATDDVAVTRLLLYINGSIVYRTSSASISVEKSLSRGLNVILVKASDAAGNVGTATITVNRLR